MGRTITLLTAIALVVPGVYSGPTSISPEFGRHAKSALPPDWHELVVLHRPLLPKTVTRLSSHGTFLEMANRIADSAEAIIPRDIHSYRHLVSGEHIVIRPHRDPRPCKFGGKEWFLSEIVIGIHRDNSSEAHRFLNILVIDGSGAVHEFGKIPDSEKAAFQSRFKRWCDERVKAVLAARERNKR